MLNQNDTVCTLSGVHNELDISILKFFLSIPPPDYLIQGKPTQSQSAAVSKDYGEVRAAEIIPGTELVDLDSDQASNDDDEGESIQDDSEYQHSLAIRLKQYKAILYSSYNMLSV